MKRENVLSIMADVVLGVCAMSLFSRNNSQSFVNKLGSAQTQTNLEKPIPSTSRAAEKSLPQSRLMIRRESCEQLDFDNWASGNGGSGC